MGIGRRRWRKRGGKVGVRRGYNGKEWETEYSPSKRHESPLPSNARWAILPLWRPETMSDNNTNVSEARSLAIFDCFFFRQECENWLTGKNNELLRPYSVSVFVGILVMQILWLFRTGVKTSLHKLLTHQALECAALCLPPVPFWTLHCSLRCSLSHSSWNWLCAENTSNFHSDSTK